MAGLYIHIPFCKQACHYCDFHFSTSQQSRRAMVDGIIREMELQQDYLGHEPIQTIYFGGGTPSLLPHEETKSILNAVRQLHAVDADAEITLEANPDDLSLDKLTELLGLGVNRLS